MWCSESVQSLLVRGTLSKVVIVTSAISSITFIREELNPVIIRFWRYRMQRCSAKLLKYWGQFFCILPPLCEPLTSVKCFWKLGFEFRSQNIFWLKFSKITHHFRDVGCFPALGVILHQTLPFILHLIISPFDSQHLDSWFPLLI